MSFCPEHGSQMVLINDANSFADYECDEGCKWRYDGEDAEYRYVHGKWEDE